MIGYAVKVGGRIDTRTVGPYARAAMVNWLFVYGSTVLADAMDEAIRRKFIERTRGLIPEVKLVKVSIATVDDDVDPATVDLLQTHERGKHTADRKPEETTFSLRERTRRSPVEGEPDWVEYQLMRGRHVVGRYAHKSMADIALANAQRTGRVP